MIGLIVASAGLAGCQSASSRPAAAPSSGKSASLRVMEQVSVAAYRCWFDSNDPDFRDYSFANELNSFSGRPRFLLVPKREYGERPLLVVQAEGASAKVEVFGPLMGGPEGARIAGDVQRWAGGEDGCGAVA